MLRGAWSSFWSTLSGLVPVLQHKKSELASKKTKARSRLTKEERQAKREARKNRKQLIENSAMAMDAWLNFPGKRTRDPFQYTPFGSPARSKGNFKRTPKKALKAKLPRTAPVKSSRSRRRIKAQVKRKRSTPKPKKSRPNRTPSKCSKRRKTPHPTKPAFTSIRKPKSKLFLPGSRLFLTTMEENCTVENSDNTGHVLVKTDSGCQLWESRDLFETERMLPEEDSDSSPLREPVMRKRSPAQLSVTFARETQDGEEVPTLAELSGFWEAYKRSADKRSTVTEDNQVSRRASSDSNKRPEPRSEDFSPKVIARRSILRSCGRKLSSNKRVRPWRSYMGSRKRIRSSRGAITAQPGGSSGKKRLASRRRGSVWTGEDGS